MLRKTLFGLVAFAMAALACAAPPHDVDVTVIAPATGGPVDGYELFLDGVSQGAVVEGLNSFPDLLPADGTYTFRVDATNTDVNRTPQTITTQGTPVTVTVNSLLEAPGTTTITIQVNCDPCVTTQQ